MKLKYSKRLLFGFPTVVENGSFNEKIKFAKNYIKQNNLHLKLKTNGEKIEILCDNARYIDIELTNYCSAKCIFCPRGKMDKLGYMDERVFYKCIDRIKHANIGKIMFIGRGEPLLHPKILDYVKYIRDNTGLNLEIFTIGDTLSPAMTDALAELNDGILDLRINVSLHTFNRDTHSMLVGLELKKIAKNIRYLISKKNKLAYSICFVKNKVNEDEMLKLRKYFDKVGIPNMDISIVYNKGGHISNPELFDTDFYLRNLGAPEANGLPRRALCKYTYDHLSYYVNYRGEFTICHDDFDDKFKLGSIMKDDFNAIDAKIDKLKKVGGTAQCKQCTKYIREFFHGEDKEEEAVPKSKIVLF